MNSNNAQTPPSGGRGASTLFDKIWDAHAVSTVDGGPTQLYIDRHFCH